MIRDEEIDWFLAQKCYNASGQRIWHDYSPTTDWGEGGRLIDRYNVDIKFESNKNWVGGVTINETYVTASGPTALTAAMAALAKGLGY